MSLELADKHHVVMQDDSYIAVRQAGQVEIWTVDGETWIGNLPEKATPDDVDGALRIYSRALDRGYEAGEKGLAARLRRMLGVA